MSYFAHTSSDPHGNRLPTSFWQPLHAHLIASSRLAAEFGRALRAEDDAGLAGLLHDIGKYRDEFQEYLRGTRAAGHETQHAVFGAAWASAHALTGGALAIAGHHAGLHDLCDLPAFLGQPKLAALDTVNKLIAILERECGPLPRSPLPPTWVQDELTAEVYIRLLFSCLIDADRLDTASWPNQPTRGATLDALSLLEAVSAERDRKNQANPHSALTHLRNAIFDSCVASGSEPQGFFSLTVPTGGGKTLASMAFALAHAKEHKLRRVIIVIPYLSIIEQNASVYREVLGADVVLEHHSNAQPPEDAAEEERSRLEMAAENWDAPVVVTTSVQFLESLFGASPAKCRKLHRIAGSVVIFDEAQTLPSHLLAPCFSIFRELQRNYASSFVFCSATLPPFRRTPSLPPDFFDEREMREIAPDPPALFRQFRRVKYVLPAPGETLDWAALAVRLAGTPQALCVVNVTRHAAELWESLTRILCREDRPIHLSAAMCPEHRLSLIQTIRSRLKDGINCRVVSTQLIEAGVDVDFPVVWRAMGPLDSIVQVAGRCNREGKLPIGTMHVFRPAEPALPAGLYSRASELAATTLASLGNADEQAERLACDPNIFPPYFQSLYQTVSTDYCRRDESSIQQDRSHLRFRTVASKAKVIEDSGRPVIVPFGRGKSVIEEIRTRTGDRRRSRFNRDDLRNLQRFTVNVRNRQFQFLKAAGLVSHLLPNLELYVLSEGLYHDDLGLLVERRPLEDFLQ